MDWVRPPTHDVGGARDASIVVARVKFLTEEGLFPNNLYGDRVKQVQTFTLATKYTMPLCDMFFCRSLPETVITM